MATPTLPAAPVYADLSTAVAGVSLRSRETAAPALAAAEGADLHVEVSPGGVLGTLCVIHSSTRQWSDHAVETLEEQAGLVRTEMEHRLRLQVDQVEALALRLPDQVGRLADVVRILASLAEHPEDPRLPRMADVARERLITVEALTQDLEQAVQAHRPVDRSGPVRIDVGSRLRRALGLVRAAFRAEDIVADLSDEPVEAIWPAARLDRALSLLLITAMQNMGEQSALSVRLAATGDGARITVTAPGHAVPLTQVMRVVGAFAPDGDAEAPVDVSARPGGTRVRNQWASVLSGPGGATFEVVLPSRVAINGVPVQRDARG